MTPEALEYELQSEEQLCFVRIHKTASTTLVNLLEKHFHANEVYPLTQSVEHLSSQDTQPYRCFYGHYPYTFYQSCVQRPVYITVLRDPVERVLSLYRHARRIQEPAGVGQAHLKAAAATGSLMDFLQSGDRFVNLLTINAQTRQIATQLYFDPTLPEERASYPPDAELLERAKTHLDQWPFFGITEHFQESVALLFYVFGWYPDLSYPSLNQSPNSLEPADLSPEAIAEIRARTQLDAALYHYAKAAFHACFSAMKAHLQKACSPPPARYRQADQPALFPLLLQHYERRYRTRTAPADRVHFDFSQALSGAGWHRRNQLALPSPEPSPYFRWTGPSTETILDLPALCTPSATVHLHVLNAAAADVLESVQLQVNQVRVPLESVQWAGRGTRLQGAIPPNALQEKPLTRLSLHVNRTLPLNEVNPQRRDRTLVGLAMAGVDLVGTPLPSSRPEWVKSWAIALTLLGVIALLMAFGIQSTLF